jgi:hypothetical protein
MRLARNPWETSAVSHFRCIVVSNVVTWSAPERIKIVEGPGICFVSAKRLVVFTTSDTRRSMPPAP